MIKTVGDNPSKEELVALIQDASKQCNGMTEVQRNNFDALAFRVDEIKEDLNKLHNDYQAGMEMLLKKIATVTRSNK